MSQKAFTFFSNCKGFALVRISHLYNFPSFLSNLSFLIYSDPYSKQGWSNVLYSALISCCTAFFQARNYSKYRHYRQRAVSICHLYSTLLPFCDMVQTTNKQNIVMRHQYVVNIWIKWISSEKNIYYLFVSMIKTLRHLDKWEIHFQVKKYILFR